MYNELTPTEIEHKKKARKISFYVHGVIVLLLIFWVLPYNDQNNIDTQFAVQVSFVNSKSSNSTLAKAKSGKSRMSVPKIEQIDVKPTEKIDIKKSEPKMPDIDKPAPPKPTDPVVTDMVEEESEIVAEESEIPVEEPEPDIIEEPAPIDIPTTEPGTGNTSSEGKLEDVLADIEAEEGTDETGIPTDIEESTPEEGGAPAAKEPASGQGTGEAGDGTGDGESGDDLDDGVGEMGSGDGVYDDSGDGIFGRKVIYRNIRQMLQTASSKSGKIVMKVCIGRTGIVTYVELNELLTTIQDRKMIRNAMSAMWDYKYEPDASAPREECGIFSVKVDNFNGIRPIN